MGLKEEIAARLQEARGDRSIQSIQGALRARGVPSTSYANVYAYFTGRTAPSLEFLEAVADELGHNAAWLAWGHGPKTDTEARAEEVAADTPGVSAARNLMNELLDGLGVPPLPPDGSELNADTFAGYRHRALGLAPWVAPAAEVSRRLEKGVRELGGALRAPLEVAGRDIRTIGSHTLSDYILNMMTVLLALAPREDPFTIRTVPEEEEADS